MSETNGARFVKESSQFNSSSRIYYYNGASVPFVWEIQPGTPKHSLFCESLRIPPLTPPPSYYSSSSGNKKKKQTQLVKSWKNPSFSWSSTSSSSSSSSFSSSSPQSKREQKRKCCFSCSKSYVKDDDEGEVRSSSSPTSTLGYKRRFSSSMGNMKRALCSVLSHRSSRRKRGLEFESSRNETF